MEYVEKQTDKYLESDLVISCAGRTPTVLKGRKKRALNSTRVYRGRKRPNDDQKHIRGGRLRKGNIQLAHYAAAQAARLIAGCHRPKPRKIENVLFAYTLNAAMAGLRKRIAVLKSR